MFTYRRRPTSEVMIGNTPLGGSNPIRVQSMASTSTTDTEGSVAQARRIIDAGAEYLRFTAQGVREAENLGRIRAQLRAEGYVTPLVADIHFNPRAAFEAAKQVEKVRINPGNFVDPGRVFRKIDYTDAEYALEIEKIEQALTPFLQLCRDNNTALRIGVNHGSLSDRIMSRYGDTPAGMAESAMEFLRVCRKVGFDNVVISIKASNVTVMVETVRTLVKAMDAEDMHYPLHLGVTEAGDGEDGRIKSAVGIGSLLADGIGDTIRVSLSEEPECELPVARALVDYIGSLAEGAPIEATPCVDYNDIKPVRQPSRAVGCIGGNNPIAVLARSESDFDFNYTPDYILDKGQLKVREFAASEVLGGIPTLADDEVVVLRADHPNAPGQLKAACHALRCAGVANPIVINCVVEDSHLLNAQIKASVDCGSVLLAGFADGLLIEGPAMSAADWARTAFAILQATRLRISHTDYISCPGCGRTLFDLQSTLARVKEATAHLKGLRIGVMGCIVNGPGEMADADYGYVGAGAGRISLYKGKECVEKNIPAEEAVEHLVNLIKANGDWK